MQRVGREQFLRELESVSVGLSAREVFQQSNCFAFHNGKVVTFNDHVACARETSIELEGAIKAAPLVQLLQKLKEDSIDIEIRDQIFVVKGKRREAEFPMETDVFLPVDITDEANNWADLPEDFSDSVSLVSSCAGTNEEEFTMTCIHITPDFIEATDRSQIARYPIQLGFSDDHVLVRAKPMKQIIGYDMTQVCEMDHWIHFKNESGLIISIRRHLGEYPEIGEFLVLEDAVNVVLPTGLDELLDRAEIFSSSNAGGNNVRVQIHDGKAIIKAVGSVGRYREMKQIEYDGDKLSFIISPKLLIEVSKKSSECKVSPGRMFVSTGKLEYVTCTMKENK